MTLYFSSVLDLNRLFDGLIHEDIPKVDLLLSQISFGAKPFSFEFKRKSFFCTRNVAIGNTFVGISLSWAERDSDGDFAIGPNFSNQRFNFKNIVLKQKQIVFNSFSNGFVFSPQS